jgi:4-hydroxy-L-threonine phosphate dehydrogenase PdxA
VASRLPVIAAVIGDAAGIGPEVCVKAVADSALAGHCLPVLIGDVQVVRMAARIAGVSLPVVALAQHDVGQIGPGRISVLDPGGFDASGLRMATVSAANGHAVLAAMKLGADLGRQGLIQGLVWGPVHTDSMKATGLIVDIDDLQPAGTFMLRLSGPLRLVPLSEHVPLVKAIELVTPQSVLALVRLVDGTLRSWGWAAPRIAVAGVNPHAMFEDDHLRIDPAVKAARAEGISVDGPVAPDSVFRMAMEGRYDAVVTMFHDQGQIVIKTVGFAGACTVYIGLPYVLLNVPHGTAFDIAGKGLAQHRSMLAAFQTATLLAGGQGLKAVTA